MANYRVELMAEDLKWPAYVSTVNLEGEKLQKAENILEEALVTLEAYEGPRFIISHLESANRTAIFFYEIKCVLFDSQDEEKECIAKILNEPWMKANSIAAASFEFKNDASVDKLVIKRKKSIKYYKDNETIYQDPKMIIERTEITNEKVQLKAERITDV